MRKLAVHQEVVVQNRRFPAPTRMRLVHRVTGTRVWKAVQVQPDPSWPSRCSYVHPSEILAS